MFLQKSIIAIIPARLRSQRLKLKNIKMFKGKPLFIWALVSASKSKYIDDVFLTTDSEQIIKIAKNFGYSTGFLRNAKLSKSNTKSKDVIIDALKNLKKKYDFFIYLQPTSPLRTVYDINSSIKKIIRSNYDSLISVVDFKKKPNGAIYICNTKLFLKLKNFKTKRIFYYNMPKIRSVDIDYIKDFQTAQRIG